MAMSEDPLEDVSAVPDVDSSNFDLEVGTEAPAQPVKRKGGRKPVYATLEERKQRNRQAQAAFRERRTEYIKQLEIAMKENETTMDQLQQSNREAVEECHMLRYKTSLLEDLLFENGIDYQSELQARSSKSLLGSPYAAQGSSTRPSWNAQASTDPQRDKRQRPQQSPQKFKQKGKGSNSKTPVSLQPQSNHYLAPLDTAHGMNPVPMGHDPINTGQATFSHSNGSLHSMHSSYHRHGHHFEEPHLDPSISASPHHQPGSYFSPDGSHLGSYLGPERFAENSSAQQPHRASHSRHGSSSRPGSGRHHQAQRFPGSPQDQSPPMVGQRPRLMPGNPSHHLYRQHSYSQSSPLGTASIEMSGDNEIADEISFDGDSIV